MEREASDRRLSEGTGLWNEITSAHGMLHLTYGSLGVRARHSPLYGRCAVRNVLLSEKKFKNVPEALRECSLEVRSGVTALLLFGLWSVCWRDEKWVKWRSDLWWLS